VVVATGTFGRTAYVPAFAADLDPAITQLHSSQYRRPTQLKDGPVLVVGASHSGCDIAYEVAEHHPTILCGRDCGQLPGRPESRAARVLLPLLVFAARHLITRRTPIGRKAMGEIRSHGGPMIRVKRADLARRGVERIESRVTGSDGGRPMLDDGPVLDVANVLWCTGFRQDFDWISVPVFGEDGWPDEYRGVVEAVPGLYFCGLSFQYAFSSMVFPGIGRDAAYVANQIARRAHSTALAVQAA
jgi:putative flavoprotein involved in K+ transport